MNYLNGRMYEENDYCVTCGDFIQMTGCYHNKENKILSEKQKIVIYYNDRYESILGCEIQPEYFLNESEEWSNGEPYDLLEVNCNEAGKRKLLQHFKNTECGMYDVDIIEAYININDWVGLRDYLFIGY